MDDDAVLWLRWSNFIRRLDSLSRDQKGGYNIVTTSIIVGPDGDPKVWTEPKITRLEPRRVRITDLIKAIVGDDIG